MVMCPVRVGTNVPYIQKTQNQRSMYSSTWLVSFDYFFSAIDKQVGEKGKKPSITSKMSQNYHTTRCSPCMLFQHICTRIVHAVYPICVVMKQGKAIRSPVQIGI